MVDRTNIDSFIKLLCDAVILADSNSKILSVNQPCATLFGYTVEQMQELALSDLMEPKASIGHDKSVRGYIDSKKPALKMMNRDSLPCRDSQGNIFYVRISISNIELSGKRYALATLYDFTKIESRFSKLESDSSSDPLTGFYNRRYLDEVILPQCKASNNNVDIGMIYMDLDRFKCINDTFGHGVGDAVLKEVSARIRGSLRCNDLVFRVGGDEFIIILELKTDVNKRELLEQIAYKLHKSIKEVMRIENESFYIGSSMGAGVYPEDSHTLDALILKTDKAMYYSKKSSQVVTFVS